MNIGTWYSYTGTAYTGSGAVSSLYEFGIEVRLNSQNIENNTSNIDVRTWARRKTSYYNASRELGSGAYSYITIAGVKKGLSEVHFDFRNTTSKIYFTTQNFTISHNADGTKTISIFGEFYSDDTSEIGGGEITQSVALNTIPRATTPSLSASSCILGNSISITLNRASSSFDHKIRYSFGSLTNQTSGLSAYNDVATSATFTPPLSLANQIPNASSGPCTIKVETYSGSTLVGTKTTTLTLNVPTSIKPTINNISVSEGTSGIETQIEAFVQNKSTFNISVNATGAYGSTISNYRTVINGFAYSGQTFTSGIITISGTVNITTTVTDTRGRTETLTETVEVAEYISPTITNATIQRCDADGTINQFGLYTKVIIQAEITSLSSKNAKSFLLKYKKKIESSYTELTLDNSSYSFDNSSSPIMLSDVDINASYNFIVTATDFFSTAELPILLGSAGYPFYIKPNGKGAAFGKVAEYEDLLDINWNLKCKEIRALNNIYANDGEKVFSEAVLYDDGAGTTGLVTLSETAANFDYIEIFYKSNDSVFSSVRVYSPNGKAVNLLNVYQNAIYTYIKSEDISISGASITRGMQKVTRLTSDPVITKYDLSWAYIMKVVGCR